MIKANSNMGIYPTAQQALDLKLIDKIV